MKKSIWDKYILFLVVKCVSFIILMAITAFTPVLSFMPVPMVMIWEVVAIMLVFHTAYEVYCALIPASRPCNKTFAGISPYFKYLCKKNK